MSPRQDLQKSFCCEQVGSNSSPRSNCSSGYDSEDDRRIAYKSDLQHRRCKQLHAQQQYELLQRYRQQQDLQQRSAHGSAPFRVHNKTSAQAEHTWQKLEDGTEQLNKVQDIPWPPLTSGVLAAMVAYDRALAHGQVAVDDSDRDSGLVWRKAYTRALLRWHPDKITLRLHKLQGLQQDQAVLQRVHEILDSIHLEWTQHVQHQ